MDVKKAQEYFRGECSLSAAAGNIVQWNARDERRFKQEIDPEPRAAERGRKGRRQLRLMSESICLFRIYHRDIGDRDFCLFEKNFSPHSIEPMTWNIQQAGEAIRRADALLITAGAGMGVDSGLPDFRGDEGFWKAYPAVARLGLSFVDMANPAWFETDPHLAWAFYGHRLDLYRRTVPHDGFRKLLEWATKKTEGYFVFTSNVDGQFQQAGFSAERIVECHGSIHHFQCADDCAGTIWEAGDEHVIVDANIFRAADPLPRCRHCGGMARPNILMFGDVSWIADRSHAQQGRFSQWLRELEKRSAQLTVIELGAGTAVPTVRYMSERAAKRLRGNLIRINPREFDGPEGCFGLAAGALEGIRQIEKALKV